MTHEEIHARNLLLKKQIERAEAQREKYPPGRLLCARDRKYFKWYISTEGKIAYLNRDQRKIARQLAMKRYIEEQLKAMRQELKLNEYYLKHHDEKTENAPGLLYCAPGYHELLEDQIHPLSEKLKKWAEAEYVRNIKYPEKLIHKTLEGHMVRSKSEVIIANALFAEGIPYRYEDTLQLGNMVFNPDFKVMRPKDGEIIYWEHFGMMDNKDYAHNAFNKMGIYADNGIIPSINLIATFETSEHPLDSVYVNEIIRKRISV